VTVAVCPAIVPEIAESASLATTVSVTVSPTFAFAVSELFEAIVTVARVGTTTSETYEYVRSRASSSLKIGALVGFPPGQQGSFTVVAVFPSKVTPVSTRYIDHFASLVALPGSEEQKYVFVPSTIDAV